MKTVACSTAWLRINCLLTRMQLCLYSEMQCWLLNWWRWSASSCGQIRCWKACVNIGLYTDILALTIALQLWKVHSGFEWLLEKKLPFVWAGGRHSQEEKMSSMTMGRSSHLQVCWSKLCLTLLSSWFFMFQEYFHGTYITKMTVSR